MVGDNQDIRWKQRLAHYKKAFALLEQSVAIENPSEVERAGLIRDGHTWLEALKDRNLTVHTYEEKIAVEVERRIRNLYYPVLADLFRDFSKQIDK